MAESKNKILNATGNPINTIENPSNNKNKKKAPFIMISIEAFDYILKETDATALGVYLAIKKHYNTLTGDCFPSYSTLIKETKLGRTFLIEKIKLLKEKGVINFVSGKFNGNTKKNNSNYYFFVLEKLPRNNTLTPPLNCTELPFSKSAQEKIENDDAPF